MTLLWTHSVATVNTRKAIFTALRFLAGGKYKNLRELAHGSFEKNPKLGETYGSWESMQSQLQFPNLLACSLDLATGTGKSYVLYQRPKDLTLCAFHGEFEVIQ